LSLDTSDIAKDASKTAHIESLDEELKKQLDALELLRTDLGQVSDFNAKAQKLIDEATIELNWNRWARLAVSITSLVIVVGLACLIYQLLTNDAFSAIRDSAPAFTTVITASVGGIILVVNSATKAVFTNFPERNAGIPMPEHLKPIVETITKMIKRD